MIIGNVHKKSVNILGLMTGSSADGLDLCLVNFSGDGRSPDYEVLYSHEITYPHQFQTSFRNPLELNDKDISMLDDELGAWFASEIKKLHLSFDFIASHGQTIKHEPPHFSLQIGNPKYMSETFNCSVIYDFRTADIEMGGQGAPLIPIVDQFLFQQESLDVLALNIGGIANLTMVPGVNNSNPLLAWDTGPGNTLIDRAVRLFTQDKLAYDQGGHLAAQGKLNLKLLDSLLEHEFYQRTPPRSAGQEQFGKLYFQNILKQFYPGNEQEFKDLIHTTTLLTAKTIARSVNSLSSEYSANSMQVGGGGVLNKTLMDMLVKDLPRLDIYKTNLNGVTQANKEAFGFAYLGYLFVNDFTANLPSVTGAQKAVTLGKLFDPKTI
ncbi:MAG: anhydro-N-acetylmuramic acid kinase [Candidatus Marinimicrobia bacterium]|jgi:anhydro-N-acetylmuramic acid kinase|nr:anhydro-N-acetylmuramic acid kinase [Candidatus Neomarinimicrobiota bacterium]MBT4419653.1 anhydro-N-acetylmuramic acid kinase [Candidatus Neomarinimicrobiota bacterium]MBT6001706.1 anhydro-N-acetylmuramic acid kinase [Candidatus Neomarinimicrobiota bacterium]MBT6759388.1 anhydro-N-acetylmuramic acid kinase [Candidatus Neomarinimicrobiota bacterium]